MSLSLSAPAVFSNTSVIEIEDAVPTPNQCLQCGYGTAFLWSSANSWLQAGVLNPSALGK